MIDPSNPSALVLLLIGAFFAICAIGLMFGAFGERQEDRDAKDDGLAIFDPRERSDGDDATGDDLLHWDVAHEGQALRDVRLHGMFFEELRDLAQAQGIRGFDVMDRLQLIAAMGGSPTLDAAAVVLTDPDEDDPYEDITYAEAPTVYIAPSPTLGDRAWRAAPPQPARPLHKHGRPRGDLTLVFEAIAEHEGHPVLDHGPDEDTRVLTFTPAVRGRQVGRIVVGES